MTTLFFDTETTRLNDPGLVQLGAILHGADSKIRGELNVLLEGAGPSEPGALAVHNIPEAVADKHGVVLENALYVFGDMLTAAEIVVGHNIQFDIRVLNGAYKNANLPLLPFAKKIVRCTMLEGGKMFKYPNGRVKLGVLYQHLFGEGFGDAHDAMADIRATARIHDELVRLGGFQ